MIEIIHEPASGVVTSAPDARSGNLRSSPSAEASGAIQIADTGHLDDYVSADDKPGGKGWIWILVVMVLGGGAFAAYQLGYLGSAKHPAAHVAPPVAIVADAGVPDAAVVAPSAAIAKATVVLQHALASDSPRVQRIAASALARTGDTDAITALTAALAKETSDLAKLDILYALARGGDKRGIDGLVVALDGTRRDVKAEAARRLALLGDKRAIPTLSAVSRDQSAPPRRGRAARISRRSESASRCSRRFARMTRRHPTRKRARRSRSATPDKADIAPALHELLDDPRQNAFAAAALANLHDPAAPTDAR